MRKDDAHVLDMLLAARRIVEVVKDHTFEEFQTDWKLQSVVEHQLMVLGEAVKRLSSGFRDRHNEIPWTAIAGHRDVLIHHYHEVDLGEVWIVVTEKLPALVRFLESIAPEKK